ncbi:type IV toxin-antitoxin system AbiEi family antitoxin domain-containing protein [Micromonospora sp. DSM 115977]|uniref:Type IV toxin-antitoxin system AbiEi family antitoxin domain-containing protein n=1 Tax=Micromonospora reichwaldensis TaxID=3075516 RepID=A0ABU2WVV1_9ACTN|nr:type IV toxin-antitoxin system AbiEi family antitoxin domain-containing protein [Micromonospora sp. DSM 115977]MDT0530050.1 type IV toxin-antitoxin system AbiEi family antitoxin domain-containing protein [Micromonospora sp. DSM 115977]
METSPLAVVRSMAGARDGIVTLAQARAAGLTVHDVHRLCRSGRWRAVIRGGYLVDADRYDGIPRRARIRAAVASFGTRAAAVLTTAAELHGIAGPRATEVIHLSMPGPAAKPARLANPEVVVHQLTVAPGQLVRVDGIAVTSPLRTVADLVLREDRYAAVCVLDSALNRGLVTDDDLLAVPRLIRRRRGAVAARSHLAEADGRAQSPLETRTRLRCVDGRVPPDALQLEVRDDDGYLLGIGDLGWRGPRVIAEADGRGPHGTPEAVHADRRRQNRLVNAGWTVLRFTWADTLNPAYIPHTVRQAIAARSR